MKVFLKPLYSKLNDGPGNCPLGCQEKCRVAENSDLKPLKGQSCALSLHQALTWEAVVQGDTDVIFNTAATGDGKSLAATLPILLNKNLRMVGMYPTIELVDDQDRSHRDSDTRKGWHSTFGLNAEKRIDRLYGEELSRRVRDGESNRFQELRKAIENKPLILTNPDIFHLITHFQYKNPAYGDFELPLLMAEFPDFWLFDEFHIFGPHQESAVINSMGFIRRSQRRKRRFLFTSATPKDSFVKQLKAADFGEPKIIPGNYSDHPQDGYRKILEPVELEFMQLKKQDVLEWLQGKYHEVYEWLANEQRGRGLIILNSVAQAGRVVDLLKGLFQNSVEVEEISGRMDRASRQVTQEKLKHSRKPVLVIGTSAVDVGVDFKIHLLIFESSDSATVIQRLGRLGRHEGFKHYRAIALLPEYASWILGKLKKQLTEGASVDREELRDTIIDAFDAPKEFQEYRREWGVVQAQGMLSQLKAKEYAKVMQPVYERIAKDLQPLYGSNIIGFAQRKLRDYDKSVAEAIQTELIRFRGGTSIQAAVWDENRFYTYDLLRLLPYTLVEVLDEAEFLEAAYRRGYRDYTFQYAQVFLKVQRWVDERIDIQLRTGRDSSELQCCDLILLGKLRLSQHPQADVINCMSRKKFLSFLVPGDYWKVRDALRVGPLFGLYPLLDSSEKSYACAFGQDALLLKALRNGRLSKLCRQNSAPMFF
ncbi:ATP-dependent RNA helicase SrmB [Halomicronema hongdechloris C2206]|uniref:ATP-dependent RNA helicase SrmB n=1 Tax=Halomicronema hongdechloris C2206 TaxID=1641165 RepID=A0A1Z3HN44_9CYAN|nr:type I-D CRISPR-associated helicase Cas3' [Halomicronema hongdechloris]ASC71710.1 ATP-dependent RNA helicase SrmB [Halomicronema hongdechloris C2206]